jgi:hypothetical protein
VFQKVDEVAGLGRLDVFAAADCVQIAATVHELRDRWIVRSPGAFFTLGVNAYMDLASSADSHATYDNPAKIYNEVLLGRFGGALDTIAAALSRATSRRVRLAEDLALPGFHVWTAAGIPRAEGGSVHFDLQYLRVRERPRYAHSTGTLSFTVPIELPAAGSSLLVWPAITYPVREPEGIAAHRLIQPVYVDYRVGQAVVHNGHILHQIGPSPAVRDGEHRLTLQGHGLVVDDEIVLYW